MVAFRSASAFLKTDLGPTLSGRLQKRVSLTYQRTVKLLDQLRTGATLLEYGKCKKLPVPVVKQLYLSMAISGIGK